jgi:hypothetical protein
VYICCSSFEDTKLAAENPIKASNAYKEMVGALKNATEAAMEAKTAADNAYTLADPNSDSSMVTMAEISRNSSLELLNTSIELNITGMKGYFDDNLSDFRTRR